MKKRKARLYFRILIYVLLLVSFYSLGFPISSIIFIGLFILLLMLLKGKLYRKLNHFMNEKFPSLSKLKPWVKKLIIIVVFMLLYIILKQIIFFVLKSFGIDIQQMILENVNNSIFGNVSS